MNREIEYRAFEPNAKQCEDTPHLDMRWWDWNELLDGNFCKLLDKHNAGEAFLMQYTGMKDKGKSKIFEGDLYKSDGGYIFEVVYLESEACFVGAPVDYPKAWIFLEDVADMERVGNKWDNPELLEVLGDDV